MAAKLPPSIEVTVPDEVRAFAEEHGVEESLPAVLDLTRRSFDRARAVRLFVEEDAEDFEDRYIVVEIDVTDYDADDLTAAHIRWTESLFAEVASSAWPFFRLDMVGQP
ncbi:MAG TPA: hypothetical protein VIL46_15740 [Gemmataceae bacterium]